MSYVLPLTLTQDGYSDATTLRCYGGQRILLTVRTPPSPAPAGSVLYQLGHGEPTPAFESTERLMPPGTLTRALRCDAIRFRSSAPGAAQYVTCEVET